MASDLKGLGVYTSSISAQAQLDAIAANMNGVRDCVLVRTYPDGGATDATWRILPPDGHMPGDLVTLATWIYGTDPEIYLADIHTYVDDYILNTLGTGRISAWSTEQSFGTYNITVIDPNWMAA